MQKKQALKVQDTFAENSKNYMGSAPWITEKAKTHKSQKLKYIRSLLFCIILQHECPAFFRNLVPQLVRFFRTQKGDADHTKSAYPYGQTVHHERIRCSYPIAFRIIPVPHPAPSSAQIPVRKPLYPHWSVCLRTFPESVPPPRRTSWHRRQRPAGRAKSKLLRWMPQW